MSDQNLAMAEQNLLCSDKFAEHNYLSYYFQLLQYYDSSKDPHLPVVGMTIVGMGSGRYGRHASSTPSSISVSSPSSSSGPGDPDPDDSSRSGLTLETVLSDSPVTPGTYGGNSYIGILL